VRSVVGRGLRLASLGAAVGLVLAVLLTGYLDELLYQVDARDPATLAAVTAGALLLALASAWLPARRVAALDPREAILAEGE
jgi:ABC-type lipoprotein release transport system permease subunit